MKVIDIVKPYEKTALDSCLVTMPVGFGAKAIEVKYIENITCEGDGRRYCEEQGEHSWFNHAMDSMRPDYPPNYSPMD